ncbi:glycoside hydrolase family 28 protein [Mucilaginibacter terrae]|uniref:glycoside hydrolase family 28 protein n=1 Tax=Mucilaginibacter terrae TaxID=1955052 RepID=UPI00362A96FA
MRIIKHLVIAMVVNILPVLVFAQQKTYNITAYGAKPSLRLNNGKSIQKAIDDAASHGGGMVLVPAGTYITGPLVLKTGVELHLDDDALLMGSTNRMDYPKDKMAVISAVSQQNIAITGNGIIDGQGRELVENVFVLLRQGIIKDKEWLLKRPTESNRPGVLHFYDCTNVKVTGVTIKNAACWVQNYKKCSQVVINHIRVISTAYWNNDGIDIVDSKDVRITNCFVNAADDGICLKSEERSGRCENIYVENCTVRSSASAFKLGTGSLGTFKNITVKNLTVYDTYRSAVALETVDGADMENINVSNVQAKNTGNAILIRLGHRNSDDKYSTIKHVYIGNVKAEIPSAKPDIGYPVEGPPPKVPPHNLLPASITGIPGHAIEDVILENIEITYGGGANKEKAYISTDLLSTVPEQIPNYPEFTMFGELPAWGLYVRHAKGIKLKNVTLKLLENDFRPSMVFDDVNGLDVQGLNLPNAKVLPTVILNKVTSPSLKSINLPGENQNAVKTQ